MGFFGFGKKNKEKEQEKMKTGLEKTRTGFWGNILNTLTGSVIDDDMYDDLEEQLILADVGGEVAVRLVDKLRDRVHEKGLKTGEEAADALRDIIAEEMTPDAEMDLSGKPAEAQKLAETAGIETHTGAKGFRNTPVWADHLLTDTEKTTVFTGNAKQAIATFPRRVNVAVATSLATTGPETTGVTMHSVPGWVGDDHCITAEIEGVKAVVDICSSTSAIAGWSVVALLRNLSSPVCFY